MLHNFPPMPARFLSLAILFFAVANVHAEVLRVLAPDLVRVTRRTLILGGILADREEVVRQAFAGQRLVERDQESDWVGLVYRVDG